MGKGKLAKFADMASYENVFQYPFSVVEHVPFEMKGHWREQYFHNDHPFITTTPLSSNSAVARANTRWN